MLTDCRAKSGHVIVCGLDGLAMRTIEQLHVSGVAVVVVAEGGQTRRQQALQRWGIPRIAGSARDEAVLIAAGLAGAVAVVCLQDDDLATLETSLLVLRLRPEVRLIVQLANPGVDRALSDLTGPGTVLDVASLAAPSVVETCLRQREHVLDIEGTRFLATELSATADGTLRQLFGNLAPIAVVPGGAVEASGPGAGAGLAICPGRDHRVAAGDRVAVIGTESELGGRGPRRSLAEDGLTHPTGPPRMLGAFSRFIKTLIRETDRSMGITIALLALVTFVSVLVLKAGYRKPDGHHMNAIDATYFTVETIGTIGYGDFSFAQQSQWLRIYAIALMIVGVTLAAVLFALVTNLLLSRRIVRTTHPTESADKANT